MRVGVNPKYRDFPSPAKTHFPSPAKTHDPLPNNLCPGIFKLIFLKDAEQSGK